MFHSFTIPVKHGIQSNKIVLFYLVTHLFFKLIKKSLEMEEKIIYLYIYINISRQTTVFLGIVHTNINLTDSDHRAAPFYSRLSVW